MQRYSRCAAAATTTFLWVLSSATGRSRPTSSTVTAAAWTSPRTTTFRRTFTSVPARPSSRFLQNGCRSMTTTSTSCSALDTAAAMGTPVSIPSLSPPWSVHQFGCLQDNYCYLLHNSATGETAVIDTPHAPTIETQLKEQDQQLTHIWNTHHHWDHTGGNNALMQSHPDCKIYGPGHVESIPNLTDSVKGGDTFTFGGTKVQVLDVGGHTKGHIAYYMPELHLVFVGDALFVLGCGRMFEGTPEQFWTSLQTLRNLPKETVVYCAHEYTMANAKFAVSVEPSNTALVQRTAELQALRQQTPPQPTVPTTIGWEIETNPFLRCDVSIELQRQVHATEQDTPVHVFAKVRAAKDSF